MSCKISVSDYVAPNCGKDVSDILQKVIDENPNRTIYFPDGEYIISKPLCTPADPTKSVSLRLDDFAVIRASEDWQWDEAMVRLGGKDSANNITTPGSNYGIEGGIIDCRGVAKGVSVDSGRETFIRNLSIKSAVVGIHIKYGVNSGSSDADVWGVNITGNGTKDALGLLVEGLDNTFTNMRIGHVFTGVELRSGGNALRNVHPLYNIQPASYPYYDECVGFKMIKGLTNWFENCYSDQFATGFRTYNGGGYYTNCYSFWYSGRENRHVAFESLEPFHGRINGFTIGGKDPVSGKKKFAESITLSENCSIRDVTLDGELLKEF